MSNGTLARFLFNAIFLIIGISAYVLGLSVAESKTLARILVDFGLVISSASLIFFIFSWITEKHQAEVTELTVGKFLNKAVKDIFQRVGIRTMASSWSDYRWNCWIARSLGPTDKYDMYNVQNFQYQFSHPTIPDRIKLVIGYSNDNDAAQEYYKDDECFIVWEMSWLEEQPLDLESSDSHKIQFLKINGEEVELKNLDKQAVMKGGQAYCYLYEVPEKFRGERANVSIGFFVRKIASTDNSINVITRLKEDCDDAEFILHVDDTIQCNDLFVYTTEATSLIERFGYEASGTCKNKDKPIYGWARYNKLLQKGSNIRFEIR